MRRAIKLSEIAKFLGRTLIGSDIIIDGLNLVNRKTMFSSVLSYATSENYFPGRIDNSAVSAMILTSELAHGDNVNEFPFSVIVSENPEIDFYKAHQFLYNCTDFYDHFEFPVKIGANATIHSSAVIEDGVIIGDHVNIGANASVLRGSVLGEGVCIGCNASIGGSDLQNIIDNNDSWMNITHAGGCFLSDGVTVSHGAVIHRSLFEDTTYIGGNAKIGNFVSIGHNCYIEDNVIIEEASMLSGSVYIRRCAKLGCGSVVLNRVTVGASALIDAGSVVLRDVPDGGTVSGNPARMIKRE